MQPDDWPKVTNELTTRYGHAAVWSTGLQSLGYPPTWVQSGSEIQKLARALEAGVI